MTKSGTGFHSCLDVDLYTLLNWPSKYPCKYIQIILQSHIEEKEVLINSMYNMS